jgi:uncharacterized membrane-anchored protein YitT (DUF2179 family)
VTSDTAPAHTVPEDVGGVLTGTFLASMGVYLLGSVGAVTGGTAGLALLLSYALPFSFGPVFLVLNLPFLAVALRTKGVSFTVRTLISVALLAALSELHPVALRLLEVDPIYAVLAGNLLAGVGILVLFRHSSSLGGFNVVALLLQERRGWRAGYVQMVMDLAVVLASLAVAPLRITLLSALGAVVLNTVLAMNHRPGRYVPGSPRERVVP